MKKYNIPGGHTMMRSTGVGKETYLVLDTRRISFLEPWVVIIMDGYTSIFQSDLVFSCLYSEPLDQCLTTHRCWINVLWMSELGFESNLDYFDISVLLMSEKWKTTQVRRCLFLMSWMMWHLEVCQRYLNPQYILLKWEIFTHLLPSSTGQVTFSALTQRLLKLGWGF